MLSSLAVYLPRVESYHTDRHSTVIEEINAWEEAAQYSLLTRRDSETNISPVYLN